VGEPWRGSDGGRPVSDHRYSGYITLEVMGSPSPSYRLLAVWGLQLFPVEDDIFGGKRHFRRFFGILDRLLSPLNFPHKHHGLSLGMPK
jgi:hypothetical protein